MSFKVVTVCFIIIATYAASVPCTQYQSSKFGNASDCSITRVDSQTITWGAQINFKVDFNWAASSYSNLLADMTSPRLPINPTTSDCKTSAGSYKTGQSVIVNCTQAFDAIPVGYANVISAFDETDYPLGFSIKVPLSMPYQVTNLQSQ